MSHAFSKLILISPLIKAETWLPEYFWLDKDYAVRFKAVLMANFKISNT